MKSELKNLLAVGMFCLLALLGTGCGQEKAPKLVMVTNAAFPPFEYVEGKKIDGIDPAIIRLIAENLGFELEIQDMNFESLIAAVQSGKADIAAAGITVTEERKNLKLPLFSGETRNFLLPALAIMGGLW